MLLKHFFTPNLLHSPHNAWLLDSSGLEIKR